MLETLRLQKQVGNTSEIVEKANIGGIATGCFCVWWERNTSGMAEV